MKIEIRRVFNENFRVYGVREVWRQLLREGYEPAARLFGLSVSTSLPVERREPRFGELAGPLAEVM